MSGLGNSGVVGGESNSPSAGALVERARDAAGRDAWQQAFDLLNEADATGSLGAADLALLADVAYAAGRPAATIAAWERAHALHLRSGDRLAAAAAAVRVSLHLLIDTGLMAPVRGWLKRVDGLLEGQDETAAHAWRCVVHGYERLLSGDAEAAGRWARLAVDVGTRCDPAAAAVGRVAEARSVILLGDVALGIALLNEAGVSAVTGELDPLSTGVVYCEVVCALQGLAQYDLADQWTAAMEGWHHGKPVGSIHGRCRVHRAEILRLRGSSLEAEVEALAACEELRPYLRRELGWPLTELGRIRLRRGDLDAAEDAFRQAHELGWDPQPGLALVYLARGELADAAHSIRDAIEHPSMVPSKELPPNSDLRLAPLLEAQVEIEIAAGDLHRARTASNRLVEIARRFESAALAAGAALARGRVLHADGDASGARRELERAVHLWHEIGAPYEGAVARVALARAHRAAGNEPQAVMEYRAARSAFEQAGASDRVAHAAREAGDAEAEPIASEAQPPVLPAAGGSEPSQSIFRRDGDHWSLTFDGRTTLLRNLKGLHYLARLLSEPGREFHVLDLVAAEAGLPAGADEAVTSVFVRSASRGDVLLDAQAKTAYRRRLGEIEEDIEEARTLGDDERAAQAEGERDFIVRELAAAVGLGGRDRGFGSDSERARASVTRAVRQAMARIREHHRLLGDHLDRTIRTGTYCAYLPDPRAPARWQL
jgi:tetratricopeptide (TPR) repeat protein